MSPNGKIIVLTMKNIWSEGTAARGLYTGEEGYMDWMGGKRCRKVHIDQGAEGGA